MPPPSGAAKFNKAKAAGSDSAAGKKSYHPAAARGDDAPDSFAGCDPVETPIESLGRDVAAYLSSVNDYVATNVSSCPWPAAAPDLMPPMQIPHIDRLVAAAQRLNHNPQTKLDQVVAASEMFILKKRLGRAADVGNTLPPQHTPARPVLDDFPNEHHFHPECGFEWYYTGCKMPIQETDGEMRHGELAVLVSIERDRAVSYRYWNSELKGKVPGWESDSVNQLGFVVATATVRYFGKDGKTTEKTIYASNTNNATWGAVNPRGFCFSKPGEPFNIQIGEFRLISHAPAGSRDILPLTLSVLDPNMSFTFTINKRSDVTGDGFFLQGNPTKFDVGFTGTGMTNAPSPGIYYSWPQLDVKWDGRSPTTVAKNRIKITGPGNGWIDHQMMAKSLENPTDPMTHLPAVQPIPFSQDPSPVSGWMWQFANGNDGTTAWTGASFIVGTPALSPLGINPYGYFVELKDGKWAAKFTLGATLSVPATMAIAPAGAQAGAPFTGVVPVPNSRTFVELKKKVENTGLPGLLEFIHDYILTNAGSVTLNAHGWDSADFVVDKDTKKKTPLQIPGEFNNGDFSMVAEVPATFTTFDGAEYGWGYLETVGFEPGAAEAARHLKYLESGIPMDLDHVKITPSACA